MIRLRPITPDNYPECLALSVRPDQRGLVAENVKSLADAWVWPLAEPMAIYRAETMIGFAMIYPLEHDGAVSGYNIVRFMIDAASQGQGHGRAALDVLIELIASRAGCTYTQLSVLPENTGAIRFYAAAGFVDTGRIEDGERVMRLELPTPQA